MPWALAEYSVRWIWDASEAPFTGWPCWACQYCITMAMLAAPQPSFSCFTKGTSSQTPGKSAANSEPQAPSSRTVTLTMRLNMLKLSDRNNNQDERGDGHKNDNQVAIAERACGEIRLRFLCPRSQLRQFSIVQHGSSVLHLLRVHVGRVQGFLGLLRREELPHLLNVLLPHRCGPHRRLLQVRGAHYVRGTLCHKTLGKRENRG